VLSCNQFTRKSDYPPNFIDPEFHDMMLTRKEEGNNEENYIVAQGGSAIVCPLGKFLAGPVYGKEETLFADIDLGDCIRGKLDMDVAGHYARPDVFTLYFNSKQNNSVVASSTGPLKKLIDSGANSEEEALSKSVSNIEI
jgi:nitrilase